MQVRSSGMSRDITLREPHRVEPAILELVRQHPRLDPLSSVQGEVTDAHSNPQISEEQTLLRRTDATSPHRQAPIGWVNRPRRPPRQLLAPALHRCGEAATFWLVDAKLIGGEPVEGRKRGDRDFPDASAAGPAAH